METLSGNRECKDLPGLEASAYIYRESVWIATLLRGFLAVLGLGFGTLAFYSAWKLQAEFAALSMIGAAALIYGALCLRATDNPINFICTRAGLYFPARKLFARQPESWLLVPWQNVLEYRVQLLFDETSSLGIVLALLATRAEEATYFAGRNVFSLPASHAQSRPRCIMAGFATFLPRPHAVLAQLRQLDAVHRSAAKPPEYPLTCASI